MEIKVGIKTAGSPQIKVLGEYILLRNMLIGDGFHWQKSLEAKLPGKVITLPETKENIFKSTIERKTQSEDSDNTVSLINIIPIETYLQCVIGSEMNPASPVEFLKAHAVISRSWALGKILGIHNCSEDGKEFTSQRIIGWDDTSSHTGFHVCSDDHCQRYQGLQQIPEITLKAIKETENEVLTSRDGRLIDARFSKCCGGRTEIFSTCWQNRQEPGLVSIKDPWCDLSSLSPGNRKLLLSTILKDYDSSTENYGYQWNSDITNKEIRENLNNRFGRNIGEVKGIEVLERGPSGRINLIRITGNQGSLELGKELWIRRLLSHSHLYSSWFEIDGDGSSFHFTGKGWGHGVGLCQIGAANMANNGYSYRDILEFYYPGAIINKTEAILN